MFHFNQSASGPQGIAASLDKLHGRQQPPAMSLAPTSAILTNRQAPVFQPSAFHFTLAPPISYQPPPPFRLNITSSQALFHQVSTHDNEIPSAQRTQAPRLNQTPLPKLKSDVILTGITSNACLSAKAMFHLHLRTYELTVRANKQIIGRLGDYASMVSRALERHNNRCLAESVEHYDRTGQWQEVIPAGCGVPVVIRTPPSEQRLQALRARVPDIIANNEQQYHWPSSSINMFPPQNEFDYAVRSCVDGLTVASITWASVGSATLIATTGMVTGLNNYWDYTIPDSAIGNPQISALVANGFRESACGTLLPSHNNTPIDFSQLNHRDRLIHSSATLAGDMPVMIATHRIMRSPIAQLERAVGSGPARAVGHAVLFATPGLINASRREWQIYSTNNPNASVYDIDFYRQHLGVILIEVGQDATTGVVFSLGQGILKRIAMTQSGERLLCRLTQQPSAAAPTITVTSRELNAAGKVTEIIIDSSVLTATSTCMRGQMPTGDQFIENTLFSMAHRGINHTANTIRAQSSTRTLFRLSRVANEATPSPQVNEVLLGLSRKKQTHVNQVALPALLPFSIKPNAVIDQYRHFSRHPVAGVLIHVQNQHALSRANTILPHLFDNKRNPKVIQQLMQLAKREVERGELRLTFIDANRSAEDAASQCYRHSTTGMREVVLRTSGTNYHYLTLEMVHELAHGTLPYAYPGQPNAHVLAQRYRQMTAAICADFNEYRARRANLPPLSPAEKRVADWIFREPHERDYAKPDRNAERIAYTLMSIQHDETAVRNVAPRFYEQVTTLVAEQYQQASATNVNSTLVGRIQSHSLEPHRQGYASTTVRRTNSIAVSTLSRQTGHHCLENVVTDVLQNQNVPSSFPQKTLIVEQLQQRLTEHGLMRYLEPSRQTPVQYGKNQRMLANAIRRQAWGLRGVLRDHMNSDCHERFYDAENRAHLESILDTIVQTFSDNLRQTTQPTVPYRHSRISNEHTEDDNVVAEPNNQTQIFTIR